ARFKQQCLKQCFEYCMESSGSDVICIRIDLMCCFGQFDNCFIRKRDGDLFGLEQCFILSDQRAFRLFQYLFKISGGQLIQFHSDRESALKFRYEITRFGNMEGAGPAEEYMRGDDGSVLRVDVDALCR